MGGIRQRLVAEIADALQQLDFRLFSDLLRRKTVLTSQSLDSHGCGHLANTETYFQLLTDKVECIKEIRIYVAIDIWMQPQRVHHIKPRNLSWLKSARGQLPGVAADSRDMK